eukprot:Pgem_evm1s14778
MIGILKVFHSLWALSSLSFLDEDKREFKKSKPFSKSSLKEAEFQSSLWKEHHKKVGQSIPEMYYPSQSFDYVNEFCEPSLSLLFQSFDRSVRDFAIVYYIMTQYFWAHVFKADATWEDVHSKGAHCLLRLSCANKGIYIKFAQHIAQLDYFVPKEYIEILKPMMHKAPIDTFDQVRKVIEEDFGKPVESLFSHFDPCPIASASLAQVHIAYLLDGRKVAVKVQHAGIRENSDADIFTVRVLSNIVHKIFPRFDYQWLVDEIQRNLPLELDFLHEARNTEISREKFKHHENVIIPMVEWDLSSHRVLTMQFLNGCHINDTENFKELNIEPRDVSTIVSNLFNDMIFNLGYLHCDPHAGNILVTKQNGKSMVMLLDHGLYRELDDVFRLDYSRLWLSVVYADLSGIKRYSEKMGIRDMHQLLTSILTSKPWDTVIKTDLNGIESE